MGIDPGQTRHSTDVDFTPLEQVLVVRQNPATHKRESVKMQWGLVTSWANSRTIGNRLIHARAETVAVKPAFREAFQHRRCLVVVDSFQLRGGRKRMAIQMKDGRPFGVGGIWERWQQEGQEAMESCAIITVPANDLVRPINDRMPLIVAKADYNEWLDLSVEERGRLERLLVPYPVEDMVVIGPSPIST
jgi:putative SOS response-associated peptidase YedK